jgi:L-lactate dehydrogenase complex protein LldG
VDAREAVLGRVRRAIAGAGPPPVPRAYGVEGGSARAAVVEAFVERVRDYRATVILADDVPAAVVQVLADEGVRSVGIAPDLDPALRPAAGVADAGLTNEQLDALDGALTTCAAACALTGTIALDGGPGQGRRALTLVPDLHVCVVREEQIVETVPELVRRLEPAAAEGRPIVLVSGPSATSDIELERVEGVHGPRRLVVIVESPRLRERGGAAAPRRDGS